MAVAGAVWLPVLPEMGKFSKMVRAGATSNLAGTGKAAGASYARGMTGAVRAGGIAPAMASQSEAGAARATKAVQSETAKVVKARNVAANATGAVRVAEARLADVRAKGNAPAGQVAAAEERLAKAQRTSASASNAARAAQANLVKMGLATQNSFNTTGAAAGTAATRTSRFRSAATGAGNAARTAGTRIASSAPMVGNFASGMRSSSAAASAFTGRAGSAGGAVARFASRASKSVAPIGNFASGMRSSQAAASAFTGRMGTVGGAVARAGGTFGRFAGTAGTALAATGGAMNRFGMAVRNKMQGPMTQTLGFMGKFMGVLGLAGVAKSAFTAATSMDKTKRVLTGLYGSGQQAGDMMSRLKRLSASSPIDASAYENAAQSLAYMGVKGKDAIGIMKNIGAASIVAGKGSEGLQAANSALLNMVNTGKVYAAQLNQISEAGVPIFSGLAAHFKTNIANVREMGQQGKISVNDVLSVIRQGTGKQFQQTIAASAQVSKSVDGQWTQAMNQMRNAAAGAMTPIVKWVASDLLPAFTHLFDFIKQNQSWLKPLAIGLAAVVGVITAITVATWAWGVTASAILSVKRAIEGVKFAVFAMKYAFVSFMANPVVLAITAIVLAVAALAAGIWYLATKTQFFQNIWYGLKVAIAAVGAALVWVWTTILQPVFSAIGTAAMWLWTTVIHPVFSTIAAIFRTVGAIFAWLWNYILHPILNAWMALFKVLYVIIVVAVIAPIVLAVRGLGAVFRWLWANAIAPAIRAIGAAAKWLWVNAIGPAFRGIAAVGRWLWNNVLKPVFGAIWAGIKAVGSAGRWLWVNALSPAFHGVGNVARWLWNNAIKPAFGAIKSIISGVGRVGRWLYNNAIAPAFRGIGTVTNWVWTNVLHPVFSTFGKVVNTVGKAFQNFGKIVTGIWGSIKNAVKGGVQMVIDVVWNNSMRKVAQLANKIPGVGSLIPDKWVNKPIKLARGGVVPGYAPGNDRVPTMLSPGEAVLVPGAAKAIGAAGIDALNSAFGGGGRTTITGATQAFAAGGVVGAKPGGAPSAPTAPDATPPAAATPDVAALQAATVATQALTAATTLLNQALVALQLRWTALVAQLTTIVMPTLWRLRVALTAVGTTVGVLRARLTAQWNAIAAMLAAVQLRIQIMVTYRWNTIAAMLAATGARIHASIAARWNAIFASLAAGHTRIDAMITSRWNQIASTIGAAHNRVNSSQYSLQSFLSSSWNWIATVVGSSVGRQNTAFSRLNSGMASVRRAIKYTADWAVYEYGRLQEAAAKPVRWVIRYPIGRGILAAWNKLNKQFNFKKPVTGVPVNFATGGQVQGPGNGTADRVPINASNGEFVVREAITKRALPFLRALNAGNAEAIQATGGPRAHLAKGGLVADTGSAHDAAIARGLKAAKHYHGKPYIWGGVGPRGVDCSGMLSVVTNALRGKRNIHQRLGVARSQPWGGFRRGLKSAWGTGFNRTHTAGTLAGTNIESSKSPIVFPGKHGATDGQFSGHAYLPTVGGQFVGGGGGDIDPTAMVNAAFKRTMQLIAQGKKMWAHNKMGQQSIGIADQAAKGVKKRAIDKLNASMLATSGGSSAGSPAVKAAVRAVAAKYGWDSGAQWNALSWLIGKESGWNPNAANPSSSARGLFQKMTSIHGALEPTVAGQAKWGLKYIKGRYGSPLGAQAFWKSHNHYDTGGTLPPGVTAAVNDTGRNEHVLTGRQFNTLVGAAGEQAAPQVRVFIGNEEITDRIDARIDYDHERTARVLRAGRR